MQRIKTDFSKRDEFDRLPIPEDLKIEKGVAVVLYDEDIEVRATTGRGRAAKYLQIHWGTVRFAAFSDAPPDAVRKNYQVNPISSRRGWPM